MLAEMPKWQIAGLKREAAFIANAAAETMGLTVFDGRLLPEKPGSESLSGDAWTYRRRGLPMLCGRAAYRAFGNAVGLPTEDKPDLVLMPTVGVLAGCWLWKWRGLAALADAGDFEGVVLKWNGGFSGLKEREEFYGRALEVLAA